MCIQFSHLIINDLTLFTWFPKTPIAQAEATMPEGNQVAASWAGIPKMKICDIATIAWPVKQMPNWERPVAKTLIQLPRQVPAAPITMDFRRP